jgi:hypothetical protein
LALLFQGTLLDDALTLEEHGLADDVKAAESEGPPIQLDLVRIPPRTIVVPDDCATISEAVTQLSAASKSGGIIEVVSPPAGAGDIVEIRQPNISIVASALGGIDVRKAKFYIKT